MTPKEIADAAGRRLWRERRQVVLKVAERNGGWNMPRPTGIREDLAFPDLHFYFPETGEGEPGGAIFVGGIRYNEDATSHRATAHRDVHVDAPGGYRQNLHGSDARTIWAAATAIQCAGIVAALGETGEIGPEERNAAWHERLMSRWKEPRDPFVEGLHKATDVLAAAVLRGLRGVSRVTAPMIQLQDGATYYRTEIFSPNGTSRFNGHSLFAVGHPDWGLVRLPSETMQAAINGRRDDAFRTMLDAPSRVPLHAGTIAAGARIQRLVMLCERAVGLDPELADDGGTPILPLVEEHLPRLLARHSEAAAALPADRMHELDMELDAGMETVRLAVEEAIERAQESRATALLDEIRFLRLRHPQAGGRLAAGDDGRPEKPPMRRPEDAR